MKITAGANLAFENIFDAGPNVPNFGMIDDIRGPDWSNREPMSYLGQHNIFWSPDPNFKDRWIKDDGRTGELSERAIAVQKWRRAPTYAEEYPRRLDPEFSDLKAYNFRFKRSSPLYPQRTRYPQYKMSRQTASEWRWFVGWSGYQPDVWNVPEDE